MSKKEIEETVEQSNLEKQFHIEYEKFQKEVEECTNKAKQALKEAIEISEKYGLPFSKGISFVRNNYVPKSFDEKWGKLKQELENNEDEEDFCNFLDEYDIRMNEYNDWGWAHSNTIC